MKTTKQQIIDAITAGIRAGGNDTDWDAPQFEDARQLTEQAGCVWDFSSWRDTRQTVEFCGRLGGVELA